MSGCSLNAFEKQVNCKLAVHGERATAFVDAIANEAQPYAETDPGFRTVDFIAEGHEIGSWALRVYVYALDDHDDIHALLAGADGIAVILDGSALDRARVADIAPYVTDQVPVLLVCPDDRDPGELAYPAIVAAPYTLEGARAVLRAVLPRIAEAVRRR